MPATPVAKSVWPQAFVRMIRVWSAKYADPHHVSSWGILPVSHKGRHPNLALLLKRTALMQLYRSCRQSRDGWFAVQLLFGQGESFIG